ncbi:MAG: thiolase family protein [Solirubrobacterales bacterium]|nr:thiolase family protein [Solirubrobacterales bacterium]OJU93945.1 MAG: beta-ketoadipyl CoA thiolase [Solirubrobacterales bacterium 67-14]
MSEPVYLVDSVRTPIGKFGGGLASVRPDDLAAAAIRELMARNPSLDGEWVDGICLGDANQAGEDNRNVARMAALLAGLPVTVPGSTVNRLCGSGLDAVFSISREIETGDGSIGIAGGVESMSRAPWVVPKPARGFPHSDETMHSTTLGWRMVNPEMPSEWTVSLGECAEILAERYSISREAQDEFALRSQQAADRAWSEGLFDDEVFQVPGTELDRDQGIRPETTPEGLARLKPVFRAGGTVTAGNSSQLSDGASVVLMADQDGLDRLGAKPRARIASRATSAIEPHLFGLGPVAASEKALARAGIGWDDLAVVELNEAYAAQSLACLAEWTELDPELVNPNGGAIAIGHPLGCSGSRLLGTLVAELERRGGGWGLATMCIGVGQGIAAVVEVPSGPVPEP